MSTGDASKKQEVDAFAQELARRHDEFVAWARAHWPLRSEPLLDSDFMESRRELQKLLGERLTGGTAGKEKDVPESADPAAGGAQYVNVNPSPWP